MNNDLTISTLSFKLNSLDAQSGSKRTEVSRGVNLPTTMTVRHQEYTDSLTKKKGIRSVLRFDRYLEMADGSIAPVSAYLVVTAPQDTGVATTDVQAVVEYIVNTIQEDDTGLNLADNLFVNREQ
jgi:hypothetical protein